MRSLSFAVLASLLIACSGDKADDSGNPTTGAPSTGNPNTGTPGTGTVSSTGWTLQGTAIDFATQTPVAEGACLDLIDPSPALTGGAPVSIATGTVGANGAINIEGVITSSTLGLLLSVKDCGTENTTQFTTATGVPYDAIRYLTEGDTLTGVTALAFTVPFVDGMQASAAAVGYTGDMKVEGFFFGLVRDNAEAPVAGATVTCGDCGPTYYLDGDPADGLFSTGAAPNSSTVAAGGAIAVIPAGPIGQYSVDDGGTHTWPVQLLGSNPASGLVSAFYAEP